MKQTNGWRRVVKDLRRRAARMAAYYRSARTTYEVLCLLDEQTLRAEPTTASGRIRFVARPGFVV
jgi:hypothetical protein